MLTVDDYGRIRRAHRDGMSIREMARTFHHSRYKIREILRGDPAEPGKYPRRGRQSAPKLGLFHERILEILKLDETAPPKQRHTAMRVFERLRDEEGYVGQYDAVRRFVKKHRESKRETFIPLDHAAGQRVEADFGEISVDFPDGRRKVNVLILVCRIPTRPLRLHCPLSGPKRFWKGCRRLSNSLDVCRRKSGGTIPKPLRRRF